MLTVRVIVADDCNKCKFYKKMLTKQGVKFETYDARVSEHQKELDNWNINDLPRVQIIDDDTKAVVSTLPYTLHYYSPRLLRGKIKELTAKQEKAK